MVTSETLKENSPENFRCSYGIYFGFRDSCGETKSLDFLCREQYNPIQRRAKRGRIIETRRVYICPYRLSLSTNKEMIRGHRSQNVRNEGLNSLQFLPGLSSLESKVMLLMLDGSVGLRIIKSGGQHIITQKQRFSVFGGCTSTAIKSNLCNGNKIARRLPH